MKKRILVLDVHPLHIEAYRIVAYITIKEYDLATFTPEFFDFIPSFRPSLKRTLQPLSLVFRGLRSMARKPVVLPSLVPNCVLLPPLLVQQLMIQDLLHRNQANPLSAILKPSMRPLFEPKSLQLEPREELRRRRQRRAQRGRQKSRTGE